MNTFTITIKNPIEIKKKNASIEEKTVETVQKTKKRRLKPFWIEVIQLCFGGCFVGSSFALFIFICFKYLA